jgi:hypothetical protein
MDSGDVVEDHRGRPPGVFGGVMVLSEAEFEQWVARQEPAQAAISRALRVAVCHGAPALTETVNKSRWLTGYLFFTAGDGTMVYAIGAIGRGSVAFHAMPWYGSSDLRSTYAAALQPFVAGKSCFHFSSADALPRVALAGIIDATGPFLEMFAGGSRRRTGDHGR